MANGSSDSASKNGGSSNGNGSSNEGKPSFTNEGKPSSLNGVKDEQKPQSTIERRRQLFKSFEAKSLRSRSLLTQIADDLTAICGSTPFLFFHIVLFFGWVLINSNVLPGTIAYDPFPFGLLTMVVSLEAIFLSIFILVSQNRSAYVNSVREEVHLRVNLIAEEEITKVLEILADMRKKMGIKEEDPELEEMLRRIDTNYIEHSIQDQMNRATKPIAEHLRQELIKKPVEMVQNLTNNNDSPGNGNNKH
jgi:uncharacterized membrane protein